MNNEGKVKYLGGVFFTKWLSFASMVDSVDGPLVAPILDKRVRDWIASSTAMVQPVKLSTTSTADNRRYLKLLDGWGRPLRTNSRPGRAVDLRFVQESTSRRLTTEEERMFLSRKDVALQINLTTEIDFRDRPQ